MGTVDGAKPRPGVDRVSMPAMRHRRLRRRQGVGVPHDPRRRPGRRRVLRSRRHNGAALMRLALVRQRYTPFGGAERFVESALEALLERNVAISLYTREWPQTKLQLIE